MTTDFRAGFTESAKKNIQGKPFLLVMAGIPASGKSSVLAKNRDLLDSAGFEILEARTFQKELWEKEQGGRKLLFSDPLYRGYYERAEKEAEATALRLLKEEKNVVLDSTYNRQTKRRKIFASAAKAGAFVAVCFCRASYETAMARNVMRGNDAVLQGRIYSMNQSFQYPDDPKSEGCDAVIDILP
jgi:predicted kinase